MPYVEAAVRRQQLVAAARTAMAKLGVARTSLRAVAAEAGVPLGTMQYVFPSKEDLLRAVIEDVVEEIADVLKNSAETDKGLEHAIRTGTEVFWSQLVSDHEAAQIMQYELTTYALRTPGQEELARWQYERYCEVVAEWYQRAASQAGETCAVPFARLARVMVASMDGLIMQYVCDPSRTRARGDLDAVLEMILGLAAISSPA